MLIALANLMLIIVVKAFYDKSQISQGKKIRHSLEWAGMALASSPAIYLLSSLNKLPLIFSTLLSGIICALFIWFFFDGFLNTIRGKRWFYSGVMWYHSAKSDKFLNKFSPGFIILIKTIPLIILSAIYSLTLK